MATQKGVWNLQQVRDKALQSLWTYSSNVNSLWSWGYNSKGQLGQNNETLYSSPIQIPGSWSKIYPTDKNVTVAEKTSGSLWVWGDNRDGSAGQNSVNDGYSSPVQVSGTTWDYAIGIYDDRQGVAAVKTDGTLWAWGKNQTGILGQNNRTSYSSPVQIGSDSTWSAERHKLDSGKADMGAIKTDGTLWMWGGYQANDAYGKLGLNDTVRRSSPTQVPGTWDKIALGDFHTIGTKTDGTLWAWGSNWYGSLGQNDRTFRSSPVQIPGTTWTGDIVCNSERASFAIKTDGTLWAWGGNYGGILGQNDRTTRSSPVQIPGTTWSIVNNQELSVLAMKTDGTLWGWGQNSNGTLGVNNTTYYSSPVQIPGTEWSDVIASGTNSTFALKKL